MIEKYRDKLPNKRRIEKIGARNGGLMPKYIRIYALRGMKKTLGDNTYRFTASKEVTLIKRTTSITSAVLGPMSVTCRSSLLSLLWR